LEAVRQVSLTIDALICDLYDYIDMTAQHDPVPSSVTDVWAELSGASDALGTLGASRRLHRAIASWQGTLVQRALAEGATWEQIGASLGSTRQAAWARFRHFVEGDERGADTRTEFRRRRDELRQRTNDKLRQVETGWREERTRLRDQLRENRRQLRDAAQRYRGDKAAARTELRRAIQELGEAIGRPSR
jgi:hypothetical protein